MNSHVSEIELSHLIINACQVLPEKSSALQIDSSYNTEENQLQVKIIDQGTGDTSINIEQFLF